VITTLLTGRIGWGDSFAQGAVTGFDPTGIFVQYGAIGAFLLITLGVVYRLYGNEVEARNRERERADRLEAALAAHQTALVEKILPVLSEATHVLSEVLEQRDRGRDRR
jgi:hypothetical protein